MGSGINQQLVRRGKLMLALKTLLVILMATYLYAYEEVGGSLPVPALGLSVTLSGLIVVVVPAVAKSYWRWALVTAVFWILVGGMVSMMVHHFAGSEWSVTITSVFNKAIIVALTFKTYIDFLVFRMATKPPQ